MSAYYVERVLSVYHWNESYFSFTCTRNDSLRFESGQFVTVGLWVDGGERAIVRAYSIASANWEEHLEFFSIKIADGALTSRLQHLKVGDEVLISKKPTGTLVLDDLTPGENLYLLGTGTGLAPFLSLTRDPRIYELFKKVILVHGVRYINDLAYYNHFTAALPQHEYLGEMVKEKLLYYPLVSREPFKHEGRMTAGLETGRIPRELGLPAISPEKDRAMLCGSSAMLRDVSAVLEGFGLRVSPKKGEKGDYLLERAFADQ
ncbi:MAG: ferredoxin--NADP reductase [Neisseriaceae bacterium]